MVIINTDTLYIVILSVVWVTGMYCIWMSLRMFIARRQITQVLCLSTALCGGSSITIALVFIIMDDGSCLWVAFAALLFQWSFSSSTLLLLAFARAVFLNNSSRIWLYIAGGVLITVQLGCGFGIVATMGYTRIPLDNSCVPIIPPKIMASSAWLSP